MSKTIRSILFFVLFATLAAWVFFKVKELPLFAKLFTPRVFAIQNTPVVVKQIQALAQLVTVSMYEEIVVDSTVTNNRTLKIPLLPAITLYNDQNNLVIIGKATTHVGLNLQQMSNTDVSGTTDSVHILLPAAEVLDVILNPSDVSVFIEKGEWDNSAIVNLKNKIKFLAQSDAESRGLLSQSEAKARQILSDFFKAAGYEKVVIQFRGRSTYVQ